MEIFDLHKIAEELRAATLTSTELAELEKRLEVALRHQELIVGAREEFSYDGFSAFFKVCYGLDILPHWQEPLRILFRDHAAVLEAAVEHAKTTTFSEAFLAYFVAQNPTTSSLIVQVSDPKAQETSEGIATLMRFIPEWKLIFPHIEPDIKKGWSARGYEIMAKAIKDPETGKWRDLSYEQWRQLTIRRRSPNFVGLGYSSTQIIGMRVSGMLDVDDMFDDNNSFSELEREAAMRKLRGPIMSRATKEAWRLVIGTPWVENDAIDWAKKLTNEEGKPLYAHVKIPVYTETEPNAPGAYLWRRKDIWVRPTWPELYDSAYLDRKYVELGEADFYRMLLLDLTKLAGSIFRYTPYPFELIDRSWSHGGGVDYASILNVAQKNDPNRSYFALAIVAKLPTGGLVVVDGIRERCTQDQAETHVIAAQKTHSNWRGTRVESLGKGEEFIGVLMRNPGLLYVPTGVDNMKKEVRLERGLQPYLASGVVAISTANTPFLNDLRKELNDYPFGKYRDAMDSVYHAIRNFPEVLMMPDPDKIQARTKDRIQEVLERNKKAKRPYNALGKFASGRR